MPTRNPQPYDVALSFTSDDRPFAAALAEKLRVKGIRVFYDAFDVSVLWGRDLAEHLRTVYENSRVCVLLLSNAYFSKQWLMFEAKAAMARAARDSSLIVIPLRLDEAENPPALSSINTIDARQHHIDEIADLIAKSVKMAPSDTGSRREPGEKPPYHVISRGDRWVVKAAGADRASRVMKTKAQAIEYARDAARSHSADEVIVHNEDGSVEDRLSTRAS